MLAELSYKLLMKIHDDMNSVIYSAYEMLNLNLKARYIYMHCVVNSILMTNLSIIMMNRLIYCYIVQIAFLSWVNGQLHIATLNMYSWRDNTKHE